MPKTSPSAAGKAPTDALVAELGRVFGTGLRSVVLYGSAAGGEHITGRSDHNVLVLVESVSAERLRAAGAALRAWRKAGHPAPEMMTVAEWRTSADTFAMEYADVLERHRVLFGESPFDGIVVRPADLRAQAEHQALAQLLRLRQRVMSEAEPLELLSGSLSSVMVVFRAVERLHGAVPPADNEALVRAVATRVGFDPAPFVRVVEHVRSTRPLAATDAAGVLDGYMVGIDRVVAHVDRLPV